MVRSSHALAALVVLAILPGSSHLLEAQTKKKGEPISGTVVSIEKAKTGRSYTLKMKTKSDEIEYDVPLVPKTQFAVLVSGDSGFLKPNTVVGGSLIPVENSGDFESPELTVYLANPPLPQFKQVTHEDRDDDFEMVGKVLNFEQKVLLIQCGPQTIRLASADQVQVQVKHNDATLIKEGDEVEVEGTIVKSKAQINAIVVTVISKGTVKAAEFFAEQGSKSTKTASSKSKKDSAAAAASKEPDPFGVLGGQAKAKPKTKPKSGPTAPGLKESDPFAVLGGDAKAKSKKTTKTAPPPSVPALKDSDPFGLLKDKAKTKAKTGDNADAEKEEPAADKPGVKKAAKAAKKEEKTGTKE